MRKIKKILIAFFTILLVYSLVSLGRSYLQDYTENKQIKELAEIRYKENNKDETANYEEKVKTYTELAINYIKEFIII